MNRVDVETDPFQLCFRGQGEAEDWPDNEQHPLKLLIRELANAGVRDTTVRRIVETANERCLPPFPKERLDSLVTFALLAAAQKVHGVEMGPIDIGTDEGREKLRQSREKRTKAVDDPSTPLAAYVRATLDIQTWNPHTYELEAVWHESGQLLRLPLKNLDHRQLQRAVGEVIGSLGTYVRAAHRGAKSSHLMDVLWNRVKGTPRDDAHSEQSEPVRLVWALYEGNVFLKRALDGRTVTEVKQLCDAPGVYPTCGIGIVTDATTGRHLIVNIDKAAVAVLRQHPDFGGMEIRDLVSMLQRAPGYVFDEKGKARLYRSRTQHEVDGRLQPIFRQGRWHMVRLQTFFGGSEPQTPVPDVPSEETHENQGKIAV